LKEKIQNAIDKILTDNELGKDFTFRKWQRETVETICLSYFEDPNGTVVIDAPTGSGKSIIAIAASLVLTQLGKTGYLIASDLSLQDQYEHDILKLKLQWGSLKGIDNYLCHVNSMPFSLGECRMKGMSYDRAKTLSCYSNCEYLTSRETAIESSVTLLNYSYWLIQRNYVEDKKDAKDVPFKERDFTFFDEAHKIDDIIQNHFSPKIDFTFISKIETLHTFLKKYSIKLPTVKPGAVELLVNTLLTSGTKQKMITCQKQLVIVLAEYLKLLEHVKTLSKHRHGEISIPKEWRTAFSIFDHIKDVHCKFEDFTKIIDEVGLSKMVVDNQNRDMTKFTCLEEQWMIKKHLHEQAGFKLFMSATIGDPISYMKIMGIENAKFIRIDNDFNYTKSPIVFVNKFKLSMAHKEKNFKHVLTMMDKIIEKHKSHKGIIHSGSYEFSQKILEQSKFSSRLISYVDSKTKAESLEKYKNSENGILIGPSILEGIDLSDDMSRFQIFFKVPYPSLSSPHIKEKININDSWYTWKTTISFAQGVGRSVRNKEDWAITYVLDACFKTLIKSLPENIKTRIRIIN
jgi:Rad3-related DNA helicase